MPRRAVLFVTTLSLVAGFGVLISPGALAAAPVSQSEGRFLSGSALGLALEDIASVTPATASNSGGPQSLQLNPQDVTALNAVNVPLCSGLNLLGTNGILALGAVNQYAAANNDGSSQAASGAVTDSGAIAVSGNPSFPADASFNLQNLIGAPLAGSLTGLTLGTGALSATANETAGGIQTGNYQISGLNLALNSPLVSGLVTGLQTSLGALQPAVDALPALIRALPGVGLIATVTGVPNVADITNALTVVTSADGSITANLQTGAVTVDIAQVMATAGLDLQNLPPNTQLMPYVTAALTSQLLPALTTAITGLVTQVTDAVNGIAVSVLGVPVGLGVLAPVLNPVIAQLVAPINTAGAGVLATVVSPLTDALTTALSLLGNVQTTAAGTFTERALRVGLLPTAPTPAAIVNLASASVGPNAGPLAAPTATGLAPNNGPIAGGQTVSVTGTDFVVGNTSVTIGGVVVPAASVTVNSPTSLTFVTPGHAAGPVDVTVTSPGGTSSPALTYTYNPAAPVAPTATSLTPTSGPTGGGEAVTVAGTGFIAGATTVTIGGNLVIATDVTVLNSTTLQFATPAHSAGDVNVIVTTAGGASYPPLNYAYVSPLVITEAPTTSGITPDRGPVTGGQTVAINGTGFVLGATSVVIGGITVPAAVTDATSLTFVTPRHAAGAVSATVRTVGGVSSSSLAYTYVPLSVVVAPPAPVITDPTDGTVTSDPNPVVSGTADANNTVTVVEGRTVICTATVAIDGTWTCAASNLAVGQHTLEASQQTAAGITSANSAPVTLTIRGASPAGGGLAYTGGSSATTLMAALLLLILGSAVTLSARLRRHRR